MRKFWPAKCVDGDWEEEWQGPIFGVHVGFDGAVSASGGGGGKRAVLRVGDAVTVQASASAAKRPWATAACRALCALLAVLVAVVAVAVKLSLDDLKSGATPKGQ